MKTNYPGHEAGYRHQRENGAAGWNASDEVYIERHKNFQRLVDDGLWPAQGRVLEMGCGAGNTSVWLARQGYEVVGVDISPTAIEWARERAAEEHVQVTFLVGNVLNLEGQENNRFDLVIDSHCLHCIIGPDRQDFLAEAFRTLKPGGRLWIETMSEPVNLEILKDYDPQTKCLMTGEGDQRFAGRYIGSREDIETELTTAGFRIDASKLDPQTDKPDNEGGVGLLFIRASRPAS